MYADMNELAKFLQKNKSSIRTALDRYGVKKIREGKKIYYDVDFKIMNKLRFFLEHRKDIDAVQNRKIDRTIRI